MKNNKSLSVIIKVTNACNLKCKYCYDASQKEIKNISIENIDMLFALIAQEYSSVQLIWHGGEPLLMGKEFYAKILELQKHDYPFIKFDNHIQTNGTLIDDTWAKFFVNNNFKVGVSYDGGNENSGRACQSKSISGRNLIVKHGGSCGVLNVINAFNVDELVPLYKKYKEQAISVQFNAVFPAGRLLENEELLIQPFKYISQMCELFDYWIFDLDCNINVEPLMGYVRSLFGHNTKCITEGCLYKWLCLDCDGNLYPCGRIIDDAYRLGNIYHTTSIKDIFFSKIFSGLVKASIARRDKCLKTCHLFKYCKGGCNSDALLYGNISSNGHNACITYKGVMNHIIKKMEEILKTKPNVNPYVAKYIINSNK